MWSVIKLVRQGALEIWKVLAGGFSRYLPDEVFAVWAECWLFEESGHEFMILDVVDVFLFKGAFSAPEAEPKFGVDNVVISAVVVSAVFSHYSQFFSTITTYAQRYLSTMLDGTTSCYGGDVRRRRALACLALLLGPRIYRSLMCSVCVYVIYLCLCVNVWAGGRPYSYRCVDYTAHHCNDLGTVCQMPSCCCTTIDDIKQDWPLGVLSSTPRYCPSRIAN